MCTQKQFEIYNNSKNQHFKHYFKHFFVMWCFNRNEKQCKLVGFEILFYLEFEKSKFKQKLSFQTIDSKCIPHKIFLAGTMCSILNFH